MKPGPTRERAGAEAGTQAGQALWEGFVPFCERLRATPAARWAEPLTDLTQERLQLARHGDLPGWIAALERLPRLAADHLMLETSCVGVVADQAPSSAQAARLRDALERLHPWRKGPFCLHGVEIDAEWRSDRKWARLADAVTSLSGRRVLDVGCGNGYYGFRALGAGAELVLGIDPTLRFVLQFLAVNQLIGSDRCAVLPLADDDLPALTNLADRCFDTLFSMGVLYHRRDALAHLDRLRRCLRRDGELVLETLVIEGTHEQALIPKDRYARMRNVHAIPTIPLLMRWLQTAGFGDLRVVDITRTTTDEQRATPWMRFQSLSDFLDPLDPMRTIEGYPAPRRAILIATRSG
ncbi:MAG: tRNA 5-methoxyuridine(34)/uridine 5-oxyacetic acid(34) synthase CmoB [Gammaproteobacteria bacterium]|nr:tRNA 5-methoxyuridine(34)/uridine 5-oxyacetic acid(34) synthase CmoB [Gammaproteobacteria bacterium]